MYETKVSGGDLPDELQEKINLLLREFHAILAKQVHEAKTRRALVRAMLPGHLLLLLDDESLILAGQKTLGLPSTLYLDQTGKTFSAEDAREASRLDLGLDDPYVILFPKRLLELPPQDRESDLHAIADSYFESEQQRAHREMNIVAISPLFGPASYTVDRRLAFVLMPFEDDLTRIYQAIVKPTVEDEEFGLVCRRADDIKSSRAIIQDIWKGICEARVIIADLTRLNPNVMYEIGIAHTVGKETILIYRVDEPIKFPFDLAHIRRIEYVDTATGGKNLEHSLRETLRELLNPRIA